MKTHRPANRAELDAVYEREKVAPLTVLVPSYREEERVVRQTLLSAALMEYPGRNFVLLIDDPAPADPVAAAALTAMRELPRKIQSLLTAQARKYAAELASFECRRSGGNLDRANATRRLARLYRGVAQWLEQQAKGWPLHDHTDALFVDRILREPAHMHRAHAAEIMARVDRDSMALSDAELMREYRRLAVLFAVRLTSFERKRFVNLSHAPNKAMNLNSYIALIGKSFHEVIRSEGLCLEECPAEASSLRVPHADYLITVDADSLLLNDYALRLVNVMEQPGGQCFGVVQTPYTAVPNSPVLLERVAAAQTDLQ